MKACCISDLHGFLPKVPECDLLLLGGDFCPTTRDQHWWFKETFSPWLEDLSKRMHVVGVAGNHDLIFQKLPDLVPQMDWVYLQDSGTEFQGFKIWGSPWQPRFYDWAFNADEVELAEKWELIPEDTDILLLHGPPRGYGDFSPFGNEHCGSTTLLSRIEKIQPKLAVAGHIHAGYGRYEIGKTIFVNASFVNDRYTPSHEPIIVEL